MGLIALKVEYQSIDAMGDGRYVVPMCRDFGRSLLRYLFTAALVSCVSLLCTDSDYSRESGLQIKIPENI